MEKASIKNFILIAGVVVVLLVLYIVFVKPSGDENAGSLASSTTGASPAEIRTEQEPASQAGDSLLRILNSLEGLQLNDSIFFNPAFDELRDISIPLVTEGNPGRRNPFAPIGNEPISLIVNNGSVGEDFSGNNDPASAQDETGGLTAEDDSFGLFGS